MHERMYIPCEKKAEFANVTADGMCVYHWCFKKFL